MNSRKVSNLRRTETKEKIHAAFCTLLETKAIEKITIKEICTQANINRTTFYNRYGSQYDVLQEIIDEYIKKTATYALNNYHNGSNFLEWLTDILSYIKTNRQLTNIILESKNTSLLNYVKINLPDFTSVMISSDNIFSSDNIYISTFIEYGTLGIILEWIKDGYKISPEKVSSQIVDAISKTLEVT